LQRQASVFDEHTDFFSLLGAADALACVLIDESQFLQPEQVRQLHRLAHTRNIPVICFGLRSDFQGQPFPGSAHLLTLADDLEEIKTICACGRKATMNIRIDDHGQRVVEGAQVEIGGNNRYQQVCARCFYKGFTAR
jgi:thymidine kinase